MKEFTSQTGGRYTYIDDILNLQELSLAITSIFDGCDNFIISGCQVSGTTLSAGYVFINGKIRYCAGASNVNTWPVYIYEYNTVEKVSYADSGDKTGRNVYSCNVASKVPTSPDTLTNKVPQFIKVASDNSAMRLKDAFFGKYALTINSAYNSQDVDNDVAFGGNISAKSVQVQQEVQIANGNKQAVISYNANGDLVVKSSATGRTAYQMVVTTDGKFQFYNGVVLLASLTATGFTVSVPMTVTQLNTSDICCTANNMYLYGTATDTSTLNINLVGYNGGTVYYRNTKIGDGKGVAILTVTGKDHSCTLDGDFTVSSPIANLLKVKHSTLSRTDKTLQSYLQWQDKNNSSMGVFGYSSATDYDLYIQNTIGNVRIVNDTYITGSLYVNGVNITATTANKQETIDALGKKANISDVYNRSTADNTFIKRTDSIGVFVEGAGGGDTGKSVVRNSIGAIGTTDLNKAVMKASLFKDIVSEGLPSSSDSGYASSLAARQRALCANIGAAYKDDIQTAQKDTGWLTMQVKNCGITTQLYVRQVGNVVSVQGQLHTHHSGTIFTLPNNIDPPKAEIGYSHNKKGRWHCVINGGSRDCVVDYCNNGCSEYIGFLMTYLV